MSTSSTATVKSRVVLGGGDMLPLVASAWTEMSPGESVVCVEVTQYEDYTFDYGVLDTYDPAVTQLFVAFDERFGNFKRAELMQAAMSRRFSLATIKAPGAVVAADARLGPNVFVGGGAIVEPGATIDYNTVVRAGAIVGFRARVKASCWIESGVLVGAHAEIGAQSILRSGIIIAPSTKVGRYCEIGVPGLYRTDIAAKTVHDPRYDAPLVVYGG
jgi:UDP-3-O-[3-hydroxymyristoyl] glucosamine N-acyltransferase